jgi:hypothetical protein
MTADKNSTRTTTDAPSKSKLLTEGYQPLKKGFQPTSSQSPKDVTPPAGGSSAKPPSKAAK